MTRREVDPQLAGVAYAEVYTRAPARFSPALTDNARVMLRLLTGRGHDLWHFFFAPNARSKRACAWAAGLRRLPTVQTVCSAPAPHADMRALLFADRTVVLSRHTEARALQAGVPRASLRRIAPAVAPLEPLDAAGIDRSRTAFGLSVDKPLVVYPGDLEFSRGAEHVLRAHASLRSKFDVVLALACRMKTPAAHAEEQRLRALARSLCVERSVVWVGETRRIHELLGAADVVALPAEHLYAKMDLPLVLIEAMLLGRAIVVAHGTPAAELAEGDAALLTAPEVADVANAIERLLADAVERSRIGERARSNALERFHPAIVAKAYEALYDELLQ
jgi:phosphatidylinositol alpha-1,6-mannosyltransferase